MPGYSHNSGYATAANIILRKKNVSQDDIARDLASIGHAMLSDKLKKLKVIGSDR